MAVEHDKRTEAPRKPGGEHEQAEGENCRCKETSKMSPAELLKLMLNDLAFWKKDGK